MIAPVILGRAYPHHAAWFDLARALARPVRRCADPEQGAVWWKVRLRQMAPEAWAGTPAWPLGEALQLYFDGVLATETHGAAQAAQDVCRAIAPLLDAMAPPRVVRRAASAAAGERLDQDEVEELLRREAAWWTRLHAQLAPEAAHAA